MAENVVYEASIVSMFLGRKIKIQGCVPQCSNRFDVNLECRNPCNKLRVIHISVRLMEGCIIRNTYNQCGWGHEEKCGGMPLARGQSFTIELEFKPQGTGIIINGCHFSDYAHRLPFDTINYITVTGDVKVCDVIFSGIPQQCC